MSDKVVIRVTYRNGDIRQFITIHEDSIAFTASIRGDYKSIFLHGTDGTVILFLDDIRSIDIPKIM